MNSQAAAIYLRVSTDQQTTDNQEPDCLRLAGSRGWEVVEIYREHESAGKRRPVFDRVMAEARGGRFRFLIVWRLDRFGRRMQGNINDVLELDSVGVDVISVREPWLGSGGSARNLLLAIFSWLAEEERRVLVERVKAGMERARREGKQCGRAPVPPQRVAAAAARVRAGVPLRAAAREQGIGWVPVRQFLALSAAERVRAGASVRIASRESSIGVDTIRRVLAGTSYLNRYPLRTRATAVPDPGTAYLPFERARDIARKLGLRTKAEWINWCDGNGYTVDIPMRPHEFYRTKWNGWSDWLGCRKRLAFLEARAFARGLGFQSQDDWRRWCRDGKRPRPIPADPRHAYTAEFSGWADWLGYAPKNCRGKMMPFDEAREYAHRLGLLSAKEWYAWAASEERVRRIACNPQVTYVARWVGWQDWLGYEARKMLPFHAARDQVRCLGLRSRKEWIAWTRSGKRPSNIPCKPEYTYALYWRGMPDWLGYRRVKWLPFYQARRQAHRLRLCSCAEWWAWTKSEGRPRTMPSDPSKVYRAFWCGWRDWLGYERGDKLRAVRRAISARLNGLAPARFARTASAISDSTSSGPSSSLSGLAGAALARHVDGLAKASSMPCARAQVAMASAVSSRGKSSTTIT